ncbi:retrovirus-related Pol polyprotein from transposon 412 [Trichonephila clavipes]|uniref:Retrovirus-related Pol polyprotein from transposon 412 n=1 Tax=Trichonephila clavipes TaxID=2585209 RepID=A0A8X6S4G9_TRICX|nr:retrovirus-related Pol polyprotein from transposon 412 [Trichonephila clavipes]
MYVDVEQKNWDEILPFVTFAYNTAKQETTGFTPFYLLHGREAETTLDTMLPFCPNDFDDNNITKIAARAEESRQLARVHTLRAQDKDRRRYDSKHQMVSYAPEISYGFILHLHAEIVEVDIEVVSPSIVPSGNLAELNRTVTCMVLKANDRRTSCPCHDEFRGPRSDYVRQVASEKKKERIAFPASQTCSIGERSEVTWQAMVGRHILEDIVGRVAQYVDEHYPVDKWHLGDLIAWVAQSALKISSTYMRAVKVP